MFTTNSSSNIPFHHISAPSVDAHYILFLDIDKTLKGIRSARELLLTTPFANKQGEYIRPIECDQVVGISSEIKDVATKISWKLKSMDRLQALSNANYYKLLMHLYSAGDKSRKLNELLREFRSICMETTGQQRTIFIKVQKEISIIARTCEQIEAETEELLDSMLLRY
jgi:hypothetical protein